MVLDSSDSHKRSSTETEETVDNDVKKKQEYIKSIQKIFGDDDVLDTAWDGIYLLFNNIQNFDKNIDKDVIFSEGFLKFLRNDSDLIKDLKNVYNKYGIQRYVGGIVHELHGRVRYKFYSYLKAHPEIKTERQKRKEEKSKARTEKHLEDRLIRLQKQLDEIKTKDPKNKQRIEKIEGEIRETKQKLVNLDLGTSDTEAKNETKVAAERMTDESKNELDIKVRTLIAGSILPVVAQSVGPGALPLTATHILDGQKYLFSNSNKTGAQSISPDNTDAQSISLDNTGAQSISLDNTDVQSISPDNTGAQSISLDNTDVQSISPDNTNYKSMEDYIRDLRSYDSLETYTKDLISKNGQNFHKLKSMLENYSKFTDEQIVAWSLSLLLKDREVDGMNEYFKEQILKEAESVNNSLTNSIECDVIFKMKERTLPPEEISKIIDNVNVCINSAMVFGKIADFETFKSEVSKLGNSLQRERKTLKNSDSGIDYITQKMEIYLKDASSVEEKRGIAMLYASIIQPPINIQNYNDIDIFIDTVLGYSTTKYTDTFNAFLYGREEREDEWMVDYGIERLTARYEMAQETAENRRFYESDFLTIEEEKDDLGNPSGKSIIRGINNIDSKLNHYKIKSNRTEHEDAALKYTAFDITFNNAFNLNDPTIQKLANLKIDLRSELSNYGIYNPDNNSYNKSSRDKFIADKLLNKGLTIEEIESLGKTMELLPAEFEKNYEILCGNFDADQDTFEKITKIYALGEVIDKIKTLFSDLNSEKLGNFMGLELDKDNPADIVGDCLFLKGKINGTETNIKYDLRTGKIYMNSFTEQSSNPPMIVVGNTKPSREIGELGSFEDAISNIDSIFHMQNEDENTENLGNSDLGDSPKNDTNANENPDVLIKKKLTNDLENIGKIVKEKAGEQGKENNVINDLLKTFNILPDYGELKDIEFMGGSKLFILLESIKNTNNESDLVKFSNQMKELMSMCELSRGKNNDSPHKSEFSSITIFDIDENNAATDIISLQKANKNFFLNDSGEKKKLESSKSHFDSSVQLSFADIIVQKCCKSTGNGRKISTAEMETFINSIKYNISDGKDLAACEKMFEDDYMLT